MVGDGSRILFLHDKWVMDNLGCTDTPFLASCRCQTRVGHWYGYYSPDSGVRRVSLSFFFFFFRFSDMAFTWLRSGSDTPAVKKKEKSQMSDLSPLPAATAAALRRSPELDRADRRAAPLSFFFFCFFFFFFALSPRCLLLLLLLLCFLFLFRSL